MTKKQHHNDNSVEKQIETTTRNEQHIATTMQIIKLVSYLKLFLSNASPNSDSGLEFVRSLRKYITKRNQCANESVMDYIGFVLVTCAFRAIRTSRINPLGPHSTRVKTVRPELFSFAPPTDFIRFSRVFPLAPTRARLRRSSNHQSTTLNVYIMMTLSLCWNLK